MFKLSNKSIGIDITDRTIEVVELSGSRILNLSRMRFGIGIVEYGRIKDEKKLTKIIKKVLSEAKPEAIKANKIIFLLPESHTYTFHITLGNVSKKEKKQVILEEIKRNIPLPEKDLVYSYQEVAKTKEGEDILVVATDKEILEEWQQFFQKLKIEIEFFDIEILATIRGLFNKPVKLPICLIDIGSVTTNIAIFDETGLRYSYAIQTAGEKFSQDLANALKIDLQTAEKKKKIIDLKKKDKTAKILIKSLMPILSEIKKSISYFESESKQKINKIILVGGSSNLKGLTNYLSSNLGIRVNIGSSALYSSKELIYLGAIGAALCGNSPKRDPIIKPARLEEISNTESLAGKNLISMNLLDRGRVMQSSNSKAKILIIILIIGILLITLAFKYRSYRRSEFTEIKKQVQEVGTETPELIKQEIGETIEEIIESKAYFLIKDTPTGFLNVRQGPGTAYKIMAQVKPGEKYLQIDKDINWYKIKISEGLEGWVFGEYIEEIGTEK